MHSACPTITSPFWRSTFRLCVYEYANICVRLEHVEELGETSFRGRWWGSMNCDLSSRWGQGSKVFIRLDLHVVTRDSIYFRIILGFCLFITNVTEKYFPYLISQKLRIRSYYLYPIICILYIKHLISAIPYLLSQGHFTFPSHIPYFMYLISYSISRN